MKYGVYSQAKHDRQISGDAYIIQEEDDFILLGLVDGLGSGEEAARAAKIAVNCVKKHCFLPLVDILRECHSSLKDTRGVVMGLLRIDLAENLVRYAGVGNIGIRAIAREPFRPISYNGIVGYRLPRVHEFVGPYHSEDIFVLYSDGIDTRFYSDDTLLYHEHEPQDLAEAIAARYGKNDDICVLVAR